MMTSSLWFLCLLVSVVAVRVPVHIGAGAVNATLMGAEGSRLENMTTEARGVSSYFFLCFFSTFTRIKNWFAKGTLLFCVKGNLTCN
jgi:hypothetical protein